MFDHENRIFILFGGEGCVCVCVLGFFSPNRNKCKDVFNICIVQQNSSSQLCGIVVLLMTSFSVYYSNSVQFFPHATQGLQLAV